eukprot:COSAG02_NODE_5753_length_4064_cov_2.870870_1_plen_63_part_00
MMKTLSFDMAAAIATMIQDGGGVFAATSDLLLQAAHEQRSRECVKSRRIRGFRELGQTECDI